MSFGVRDLQDEPASFHETRWTLVAAAGGAEGTPGESFEALSELCRIYWRPLYFFLRRERYPAVDAQDLTQGFFADLIENRAYMRADRQKGRFRSFLLGALKHFVADQRAYDSRQKRGGVKAFEPFDEEAIHEIEATQISSIQNWNADALYEREWAAALLRQTLDRLTQESAFKGRSVLFEALRTYLPTGGDDAIPYELLAERLQRGILTLRSDVARLRARFRAILREEVCGTLTDPREVGDELRYLCQVLARA